MRKMSSNDSGEILRPLNSDDVKELMSLYRIKYGKQNFHYLLLYNQCKWNENLQERGLSEYVNSDTKSAKWNGLHKTFYSHRNGDFRKHGTYISFNFDLIQSVSFNSWEPGLYELYECLEDTKLIDWASGPLLTNVCLEYCDRVKKIAVSKGIGVQRARLSQGFLMAHEKALHLDIPCIPCGFEMRELLEKHAEIVHNVWPNKNEGSLDYVRCLILVNKSLGIFRRSDGALVSWIIQNDFAGLGFLQTLEEEQRRGFGRILTSALTKRIAETEQVDLSVWIVSVNFKSLELFEKIGYEKIVSNEWIKLCKK